MFFKLLVLSFLFSHFSYALPHLLADGATLFHDSLAVRGLEPLYNADFLHSRDEHPYDLPRRWQNAETLHATLLRRAGFGAMPASGGTPEREPSITSTSSGGTYHTAQESIYETPPQTPHQRPQTPPQVPSNPSSNNPSAPPSRGQSPAQIPLPPSGPPSNHPSGPPSGPPSTGGTPRPGSGAQTPPGSPPPTQPSRQNSEQGQQPQGNNNNNGGGGEGPGAPYKKTAGVVGSIGPGASAVGQMTGNPTTGKVLGAAFGTAATGLGAVGAAKDGDGLVKGTLDNLGNIAGPAGNAAALAGQNKAAQAIGSTLPTIGAANKAASDVNDIRNAPEGERGSTALRNGPGEAASLGGNLLPGPVANIGAATGTMSLGAQIGTSLGGSVTGVTGSLASMGLNRGGSKPGDPEAQNQPGNKAPRQRRHLTRRGLAPRQVLKREAVLNELMRRQNRIADKF